MRHSNPERQVERPNAGRARFGRALSCHARDHLRLGEIVIAIMLIAVTLPLMAIIALMIKCDSPGPVLDREKRLDKNGKVIVLLKFRTRYVTATSSGFTRPRDSMTPVGRLLHYMRLDQLPGLFSVLRGRATLTRSITSD